MRKTLIILFFLSLVFPMATFASEDYTVKITDQQEHIPIRKQLLLLEDRDHRLTIDEIMTGKSLKLFEAYASDNSTPNFGYTDAAYWVIFDLQNTSEQTDFLLEIGYPALQAIELYRIQDEQIVYETIMGARFPYSDRSIDHPNFLHQFTLDTNELTTFILRIETTSSLQIPLDLYKENAMNQFWQTEILYFGLTYGILTVMALYNFFLFISLRDRSYLFYVLVIFATFMSNLSFTGVAYQYLWSNFPKWNELSTIFFLILGMIFALSFAYHFLAIKKSIPSYRKVYSFSIILGLLMLVMLFISFNITLYLLPIILTFIFIVIFTSAFKVLLKGYRQARFFIIAWSVFLLGVLITVFSDGGLIPLTIFTKYAGQTAATIEVVLLSFALADRINILQQAKRDTTEQLYLSEKRANENLLQADKLKDEFLATTSHELRTPLNGIIGISEMLAEGAAGTISAEVKEQLALITLSGKRLVNLINDILDYAKLKNNELKIHLEAVRLYDIVEIVLLMCAPAAKKKGLLLINEIEKETIVVKADVNRLQQILFNLIGNAITYTDVGSVTIKAKEFEESVRISIIDTGIGISNEQLLTIFDQFKQIDYHDAKASGGTGIGLSITKKLVELHGGDISVESVLHQGSSFSFSLSRATKEQSDEYLVVEANIPISENTSYSLMSSNKISQVDKEKAKILIADDEIVNLQVLPHQLSLEGYEVVYATNGEEVLNMVSETEVDLVILDIMMPKLSGIETCKRLRQNYSLLELPILMLTAKDQLQDKVLAFKVGANDYLTKPCERKELLSRVETLVNLRQMNQQLTAINISLEKSVAERTRELQEVNDRLIEALDSRRMLLANISHDLGNPVTTVHTYLQALQAGLVDVNDENYMLLVNEKINLLTRLIDDLADLSKLESKQIEYDQQWLKLSECADRIKHIYEAEVMQAKRQFKINYPFEILREYRCFIDVNRMEQVFTNIIWNAIYHTKETTGEIEITIEINEKETDVLFIFSDNGKGIAQEDLPFIFERFYKGKINERNNLRKSTGLGLAIVKEIVTDHHGEVWAESEMGQGSSFYISLPIKKTK